ncbi:MAG: sigma-54-dependent Fis family transcriptional regulator [Armatimonadetes bacterium]|nr:sigma-54-dependent Fis family transcriptional regulator [Armatimonadota bacterium]
MNPKARILIADDEPNICKILQAAFERAGYQAVTAESAEEALKRLAAEPFDLLLTDVLMPGKSGIDLLKEVKERQPEMPVLVMTAFGTIPQAVEAIRAGAADYITKPFDLEQVKKAAAFWLRCNKAVAEKAAAGSEDDLAGLIGDSPRMQDVFALVRKIADSRATVLITGESGTGKEVVARAIHRCGGRASKPFIAVSCAALPETLLESELFGHEKGAFTGADRSRPGRFELADGGTLFLDEIGEVPPSIQVKLLRVLQERELDRLGGTAPVKVDVRLIAATNRDLAEAMGKGEFRKDLFYRLQVLQVDLPPLRERREDIMPLALHFLERYGPPNASALKELAAETAESMRNYSWPGNVRELENVIERAVVLAPREQSSLTPDLLPPSLQTAA